MPSLLTVGDLIADPALDTHVIAGSTGLNRTVRWAQTSESAEPWRWIGTDELLLTLGLNLPADPDGQVNYVRQVHAAGIPGIAVGADGLAPEITDEMKAEADALALPLLSTGTSTPFVVITRTVATVTTNQLNRSVLILSRLYQEAGSQSLENKRAGEWIQRLSGFPLAVQDTNTGCIVIGALPEGVLRRHSLSTLAPTQLLVPAAANLDALLLVHLKLILTVDANALLQEAHNSMTRGESTLRLALEGKLRSAQVESGNWLSSDGTFHAVAADSRCEQRLAMSLALHRLPPLSTGWKSMSLALVRTQDVPILEQICLDLQIPVGLSSAHSSFADLSGAAEEARSAYAEQPDPEAGVHRFTGMQVSLLARSESEAENIIHRVLGPLTRSDEQSTIFRQTLFALLDHDLQWQKTAAYLGIHRQTLAYRIRQVESFTGRSVRKVPDLSDFYLACTAWRMLHTDN